MSKIVKVVSSAKAFNTIAFTDCGKVLGFYGNERDRLTVEKLVKSIEEMGVNMFTPVNMDNVDAVAHLNETLLAEDAITYDFVTLH